MPEGLAVLKWDDELGPVVTAKAPKSLQLGLDPTTSMRVYGIATLGETEESQKPSFSALTFPDFKLAVYYGGLNMHLKGLPSMVFLVLSPDEDPDLYKDAVPEIATQIFLNSEGNKYVEMVPKLFAQVARYTQMSAEQKRASVLHDPVRRTILQTLMRDGTIQSSDLERIIFEEVGKKVDVDIVLRPMIKMGIIATDWVEGLSSEVIYLVRAILVLRMVPDAVLRQVSSGRMPPSVADQYLDASKKYHRSYIARLRKDLAETIWDEAASLAGLLVDFDSYSILTNLRENVLDVDQLSAILGLEKPTLRKRLKSLEDAHIVIRLTDEDGRELVMLKSDPQVVTLYPSWLIQRTVDLYNDGDIPPRQASHYLELLKTYYPSRKVTREVA
ncbi:MAG: helix-turn-helix domain-containing protein [Candidatus Thorarchaeota archaeon]